MSYILALLHLNQIIYKYQRNMVPSIMHLIPPMVRNGCPKCPLVPPITYHAYCLPPPPPPPPPPTHTHTHSLSPPSLSLSYASLKASLIMAKAQERWPQLEDKLIGVATEDELVKLLLNVTDQYPNGVCQNGQAGGKLFMMHSLYTHITQDVYGIVREKTHNVTHIIICTYIQIRSNLNIQPTYAYIRYLHHCMYTCVISTPPPPLPFLL